MSATPDPRATVVAEHWSYGMSVGYDGWECECGTRIMGNEGDTDAAMQAHLVAVLAALDAPATEPDTTDPADGLTAEVES